MHRATLLLAALALAAPAPSRAADAAGTTTLERVEVVGSRIARIDAETALPVQVITRAEIERSGVQTVEELLSRISANVGAWTDAINIGNDAKPGFSGASLRGLGSATTLVLLNGRRLANYAFSAQDIGVDLHAIPLAAIERVEVLKDGASSLYGSDAIAGVVNFVLRSDFRGLEVSSFAGASEAGGGSQRRATIAGGLGDAARDGYNVFAVVDHQRNGGLAARDRSFSSTAYRPAIGLDRTSSMSFPANIPLGHGRYANPAAPACTDVTVAKNGACYYDYARQTDDLAPSQQTSLLGRGSLRLGNDHEAFVELLHEAHRARYRVSATPVGFLATNGAFEIDVPTTSPYYPQGLGLQGDLEDLRYRTVSLGPRTSDSRSDNQRALVGLKGTLGGWAYDAGVAWAASHARYRLVSGYIATDAAQAAFASGLIDPFGDPGPVGQALLADTQVRGDIRRAVGTTRTVDAHASRDLLQLPAGPLAIALGGEWRRETLDDVESLVAATIVGNSANPPKSGERSVGAAFVELDVPVLRALELQLSARHDRYSDFGGSSNPKLALRWQPTRALLFRASVGRGFRAPSLPELFTAQAGTLVDLGRQGGDPVRCPVTGLDSDCEPAVVVGYGGNPQLRPVHSTQASLGLVVEPTKNWNARIDYWRIRLRDNIGSLDVDTVFANPAAYEGRNIVRGPVDPAFPGLPGPIVRIDTYNENLGHTRTAGFDVAIAWRSDPTPLGRFGLRLDGTRVTTWEEQLAGIGYASSLGAFVDGGAIPRWKHQLTFDWEQGPWSATASQAFRSGYTDQLPRPDGSTHQVASYALWDLQLARALGRSVVLRAGARNVFDRDPPASNQSAAFQAGYDPSYADPRGRFFYLAANLQFR